MSPRAVPRRIVVVGGGQVALLAAIALRRALPRTEVGIAPAPVAADALADTAHTTLPSLARLHARIGIDESGMVHRAMATHRLATRYRDWFAPGDDWMLGYGAAPAASTSGFAARWTGAASVAGSVESGPVVIGSALALAGRFAPPSDVAGAPLSDIDYALRFDPAGHVRRLRSLATHIGIGEASLASADTSDLIVETRAGTGRAGWIDWSRQLPGRGVEVEAGDPALAPLDDVRGTPRGYTMRSPGRDATRIVRVGYDGSALAPGRIADAWSERTIAIGDAATAFEPLGWCNLHVAVCQIELLLELLPGREIDPLERAEYNRRSALLADRVRDFVAAHHFGRVDLERSAGLERTLSEFSRRGRLPYFEEESVPRDLWLQLLGVIDPQHALPPRLRALEDAEHLRRAAAQRRHVAAALAAAEPYPAWLARQMEQTR